MIQLFAENEQQQEQLGAALASCVGAGAIVYLQGDLGAGKTTLVRGLLHAMGHAGAVKSPTYTLIEPYQPGSQSVYHFDLYRLADPEELEFLGLRDMLEEADALLLFEWPERGEGALPASDLVIQITHHSAGRELSFQSASSRGETVILCLKERLRELVN